MNNNKEIFLSLIVPVYNEERSIEKCLLDLNDYLSNYCDFIYEIVVVNDGSVDKSSQILNSISSKYKFNLINKLENKGLGSAFWTGVENSKGKFITMVPGDGELNFKNLSYSNLLNFTDCIIVYPVDTRGRAFIRNFISLIFRQIINTTFRTNFHYTNGTNFYNREKLLKLERNNSFLYQVSILIEWTRKYQYTFVEAPMYPVLKRDGGRSNAFKLKNVYRLIREYFKLIIKFYFKKEI